jgi:DNA-binding MarR family transcriptional regulator
VPNQTPSAALSAIEEAVGRHPNDASAQEIMRGLGTRIPLRTLQYRLKSLVERNRLVMVGEGRWAKYRIREDTVGAAAREAADERSIPLSSVETSIRDSVQRVPGPTKPAEYSPDMQPDMVVASHNPQTKIASALAQDLGMLTGKLKRRLREQADPGDLTLSQISVLVRLEKDGPATASNLARSEGMRPQSLGTVIATLEAADLVTGAPHPTDGRQTLLSLTDACRQWFQEGRAAREDWLTRTIQARLSPQEQDELLAAVELLKRIVDGC